MAADKAAARAQAEAEARAEAEAEDRLKELLGLKQMRRVECARCGKVSQVERKCGAPPKRCDECKVLERKDANARAAAKRKLKRAANRPPRAAVPGEPLVKKLKQRRPEAERFAAEHVRDEVLLPSVSDWQAWRDVNVRGEGHSLVKRSVRTHARYDPKTEKVRPPKRTRKGHDGSVSYLTEALYLCANSGANAAGIAAQTDEVLRKAVARARGGVAVPSPLSSMHRAIGTAQLAVEMAAEDPGVAHAARSAHAAIKLRERAIKSHLECTYHVGVTLLPGGSVKVKLYDEHNEACREAARARKAGSR